MTYTDDSYSEDVLDLPRGEIDVDTVLDAFYYGDDNEDGPFDFGPDYGYDDLFDTDEEDY